MVLTLKVTARALNYMDAGAVRDTAKRNAHLRRVAVEELPNPLEYAGWLMFPCTLVVGPAIEFREYHDWLHGKGHYGGKDEVTNVGKMDPPALRSRYARSLWLVAYSSLFCFVHLFVMRVYTLDNTYLDPAWSARPLWRKFWELHILGQGSRGKYFFCWVWAEAACVASGVGFGGTTRRRANRGGTSRQASSRWGWSAPRLLFGSRTTGTSRRDVVATLRVTARLPRGRDRDSRNFCSRRSSRACGTASTRGTGCSSSLRRFSCTAAKACTGGSATTFRNGVHARHVRAVHERLGLGVLPAAPHRSVDGGLLGNRRAERGAAQTFGGEERGGQGGVKGVCFFF